MHYWKSNARIKKGFKLHILMTVVPSDFIDFDDDLIDDWNAFYAIHGVFSDSRIIVAPHDTLIITSDHFY